MVISEQAAPRKRQAKDPAIKIACFIRMVQSKRPVLREERTFVSVVEGTFGIPATLEGRG